MSICFSCSGLGVWPMPSEGACAGIARVKSCAAGEEPCAADVAGLKVCTTTQIATMIAKRLRAVAIRNLSVRRDLPRLNSVVVILRVDPAHLDQLAERRLRVAGVVGAT